MNLLLCRNCRRSFFRSDHSLTSQSVKEFFLSSPSLAKITPNRIGAICTREWLSPQPTVEVSINTLDGEWRLRKKVTRSLVNPTRLLKERFFLFFVQKHGDDFNSIGLYGSFSHKSDHLVPTKS